MKQKAIYLLSRYPLSLACIVLIWILCFCTMPHTPLDNVHLIDKWVHIAMYGGTCTIIWIEYLRAHKKANSQRVLLFAWICPIVMSGAIELLQAYCTGGRRSGDWLDFAANSLGATLAMVIGILLAAYRAKRNKDSDACGNCRTDGRR